MVSCPIKHRITVKSRRTGTNCRILGYVLASRCQRVLAWNVTSRMVGTLRFQPIFVLSCDSVAKTILWDLGWNGEFWILNMKDIHTWSYRDHTCNHYIYICVSLCMCVCRLLANHWWTYAIWLYHLVMSISNFGGLNDCVMHLTAQSVVHWE